MKVLITGAGSFLGKWVIRELQSRGHEVLAFRHGIEMEEENRFGIETVPAAGWTLPEGKDRPVLIHFGWAGAGSAGRQDEEIQAYNIDQSMETLKLAERLGCRRFLFAGSQAEYSLASAYGRAKREFGEKARDWLAEFSRPEAVRYRLAAGKTGRKQTAGSEGSEERSEKAGMEFLHLRIFSVYGPGDHETSLISSLIRAAEEGRDLELGPCTQLWNYLYAQDFARILADLAERKEKTDGIMDIGSEDYRPLAEYVREAWEICKQESGFPGGELKFGVRANNAEGAADLLPDLTRLKETVAIRTTPFSRGIALTLRESYFLPLRQSCGRS